MSEAHRDPFPDLACQIYAAHALSAFGDRLWQFALPIVLVLIFPDSLLAPSLFMLVDNLLKIALVPPLCREMVRHDRLWVISLATVTQCACCAGSMALLLWWDSVNPWGSANGEVFVSNSAAVPSQIDSDTSAAPWARYQAVMAAVLLGSFGDVASNVSTIATEKDWVVVIAHEMAAPADDEDARDREPLLADGQESSTLDAERDSSQRTMLLKLNTNMRQIDLLCKMVAPAAMGALLAVFPDSPRMQTFLACASVMGWQLMSFFPMYAMWRLVYNAYPSLSEPHGIQHVADAAEGAAEGADNGSRVQSGDLIARNYYLKSSLLLASLSYVCLFLTVLSESHVLTTAYLIGPGLCSPILIVALRVGGSLSGLLGAAFCQHQGPSITQKGGLFVTAFWMCICTAGLSVQFGTPPVSSYILMAALVASRFNLWSFDLTINTLIQTEVHPPSHRPAFTAMQSALCKVCETLTAVTAVITSSALTGKEAYSVLVWVSMSAITISMVLFQLWDCCSFAWSQSSQRRHGEEALVEQTVRLLDTEQAASVIQSDGEGGLVRRGVDEGEMEGR